MGNYGLNCFVVSCAIRTYSLQSGVAISVADFRFGQGPDCSSAKKGLILTEIRIVVLETKRKQTCGANFS